MTTDAPPSTTPQQIESAQESDRPKGDRPRDVLTLIVCSALLLLFAILSYSAVVTKSATYDEPLHAVSGYLIRNYDDYRIDPEDPALFTWLSALPNSKGAMKVNMDDPHLTGKVPGAATTQPSVTETHDLQWFFTVDTMYRTKGNDADRYLNRSRFVFMLIGLACGGVLCWWAWKLGGRIAAFAATACYALDPNFIGHASLLKNDVPLALVTVGLMFALWRAGKRVTWWNLAGICVALAGAMNVKFSGPVFFIIAFLALLVRAVMNKPWKVLNWELPTVTKAIVMPFAICIVAGIFSWISIWACYGFRYAPTSNPNLHFDLEAIIHRGKQNLWQIRNQGRDLTQLKEVDFKKEVAAIPTPALAEIVGSLESHKLLPEAWLNGFYYTYATTLMRGSYLNGYYAITGWWYFFPLSLLYKTPTAILVAVALAMLIPIIGSMRRGTQWWDVLIAMALALLVGRFFFWAFADPWSGRGKAALYTIVLLLLVARLVPMILPRLSVEKLWIITCIGMPILIYGGMAMTSSFNLGIRHVLPLLPFLHLAVGLIVARAIVAWGKLGVLLAVGLGMSLAIESCSAWPDYLAFFNAPAGGWRGGIYHLSDSNLDWGQDLKLLAEWHKNHKDKVLYLCYFGTADPNYYGIDHIDLVGGYDLAEKVTVPQPQIPGIIAMSATRLQGTYMSKDIRELYTPIRTKLEPREILGGTIYLFDWPLRPPTTQQ